MKKHIVKLIKKFKNRGMNRFNRQVENDEFFEQDQIQAPIFEQQNDLDLICNKEIQELEDHIKFQKQNKQFGASYEKQNQIKNYRRNQSSQQYNPYSGSYDYNSSDNQSNEFEDSHVIWKNIRKYQKVLIDENYKQAKIRQLSKTLGVSAQSIKKKIGEYFSKKRRYSQKIHQQKYEHQNIYRKTEMFDDAIKKVLKVTPYACINDLKQQIKDKLGLQLAKQTLIRRLKNLNFAYKKFTIDKKMVSQEQDEKLFYLRQHHINNVRFISNKSFPIYFYGMCHFALDQCRGSMWMKTKQGSSQLDHILYEKDVVHICLIISQNKIQFYKIFQGFYSLKNYQKTIIEFINRFADVSKPKTNRKILKQDKKFIYLLAQASQIHNHNPKIKMSIKQKLNDSGVCFIPIPPYSYHLNPAEVLFQQIKYLTKSKVKHHTRQDLTEMIHNVIKNQIDIQDIKFSFAKVEQQFIKFEKKVANMQISEN